MLRILAFLVLVATPSALRAQLTPVTATFPTTLPDTLSAAEWKTALKSFKYTEDKMSGVAWYTGDAGFFGPGLNIYIRSDGGSAYLLSRYSSTSRYGSWIFHKRALVRIGNVLYDTGVPESEHIRNDVVGSSVLEINSYVNEEVKTAGLALVSQIASAAPETPIMVRLYGDKVHDYEMPLKERQRLYWGWRIYVTVLARQGKTPDNPGEALSY
jgi:hypothetical protein